MRSTTRISSALLLCLAGLSASGAAQQSLRPSESFASEFDPVRALTLVYGREPWNDLLASRMNTFENGRDFIEPLFDAAYVEGGVQKHVVIATLTPRPRSQYSCHACSPMLGGAVFRRDGDVWHIESTGLKIEPGHAWFPSHGRLSLVRLGPDRFGLLHQIHDMGGGQEAMRASVIFGVDGVLAARLALPFIGGPGPGACGVPAQHLKVQIIEADGSAADPATVAARAGTDSSSGFFDVMVDALWNEARCELVEEGMGAKSSGRACQRITRYRYRDGAYGEAAVESDVCRQLPEQTTSFRG